MIRSIARNKDAPFIAASNDDRNSNAGFPADFQELCGQAMDQALGVEKVSLSTLVDLNSTLFDIYKNSFWLAPVFSDFLDAAAKAFTLCIDLQMSCLAVALPHAKLGSEALSQLAAPGCAVWGNLGSQAHPAVEEVEQQMDVAMGKAIAA
jgi:hypothetical protein